MTKLPALAKIACITFLFCIAAAIAAPAQTFTDLYDFGKDDPNDPNDPCFSVIAQGRDGNLYTTSPQTWSGNFGDVFRITPAGVVTALHSFNGTDGSVVNAGLTLGIDGNFYGAAQQGGVNGFGTIFKISPQGNFATLYNFTNGADGGDPVAVPIQARDGNFYGTTAGLNGNNGSVYKITSTGKFTVLHAFNGPEGATLYGPLVEATDGNFYGLTRFGGSNGLGTIFKMNHRGQLKVLHNFDGAGDGGNPSAAGLIQASNGDFYGVAFEVGTFGGALFKITQNGEFTNLHNFTGGSDGGCPVAGLWQATDGNIYGTVACPTEGIFRITPDGVFTTLYTFTGQNFSPQTQIMQHTNGILYGETPVGGAFDAGIFYSLDVGLSPFVTFLPAARPVGGVVEILGQGFTGTTAVSFHRTPAAFTVHSDTFLTATIPAGATNGFITVTTPAGTLQSNKVFRVNP
jgi:uncharacterized repeat protein (TIGR03803 family)